MITAVEKTLTCLAMPCGLMWLGLVALTLLAWRRKQRALLVWLSVLLAIYTLAGNNELSKLLMRWLERDYARIRPLEQGPYDAVFVLGGGVGIAINGDAQLESSGDRAALGARLYHTGRTQRLAASGMTVAGPRDESQDSAEATAAIWREWAVPEEHILQFRGTNTREEMSAIRRLADEHPEWKRLGLVTSAWHLPRAMRLAKKQGLAMEPLPANFRGTAVDWSPWLLIIPNADGFLNGQLACKEILARMVGQ